jgi:hypothetical protein
MSTTMTGAPTTAAEAKANAKAILDIHGFQLRQGGQLISVETLDPASVGNFYYTLAFMTIAGDYRNLGEGAIGALTSVAGVLPEALASILKGVPSAETIDAYRAERAQIEAMLAGVSDTDTVQLVQRILGNLDDAWSFMRAARRVGVSLAGFAIEGFDDVHTRGRVVFSHMRPALQELMGRPQPAQVEAAISAIEAAETGLDEMVADFERQMSAMLVPDGRALNPCEPLDSQANQPRMRLLNKQLAAALPQDAAQIEPVLAAVERAAGMIMTVMTGIRQLDERLSALGVTSA